MILLAGSTILARTATPSGRISQNLKFPGQSDQFGLTSEFFAYQAALAGMYEIQAGVLALSKGWDSQVKAFGRCMVRDHGAANNQLLKMVGSSIPLPQRLDASHQAQLDKLKGLEGYQFDAGYGEEMMKGHQKVVDLFIKATTSLRVSAELRAFARGMLPTLQEHNAQARARHQRV